MNLFNFAYLRFTQNLIFLNLRIVFVYKVHPLRCFESRYDRAGIQ